MIDANISVHCGELPEMTNGNYTTEVNKSVTLYPYNTQYQYTCVEGYNATLIYSTNCSETGDWTPAPGCFPG